MHLWYRNEWYNLVIDMWHVKYNETYIKDINQRLQAKPGLLGK